MRITQITPTDENGKRQIYMDGELFATLTADIVMSLDLHSGDELTEAQAEELILRVESLRALQKAYSLLSYNAHSRKALAAKLQKADFSDGATRLALERLEELGLIDDRALALRLIAVMRDSKHWGKRRAVEELYKRGIPRDMAEELTVDYDGYDGLVWQLEHKYRRRDLTDPKERQKVTAGLVRLGFSYDEIRHAFLEFEDEI